MWRESSCFARSSEYHRVVHFWNLLPKAHCGKVTLFRFSSFFMFIMAGCCHRGACLENLGSYLSRIIESSDSLSPRSQGFSKITLPPAFVISFAISTDLSTSKLALSTSLRCAELSPSILVGCLDLLRERVHLLR